MRNQVVPRSHVLILGLGAFFVTKLVYSQEELPSQGYIKEKIYLHTLRKRGSKNERLQRASKNVFALRI